MNTEKWYLKSEPRGDKWTWILYAGNHRPVAQSSRMFDVRALAESFGMIVTDNQFPLRRYQGGPGQTVIQPEEING